jgi:PhoH-like ATPase
MSEAYTGFRQLYVPQQIIDEIHYTGSTPIWAEYNTFHPNLYLELKSYESSSTALARVSADKQSITRVYPKEAENIKPRNREQIFAIDALLNSNITVVVFTGAAGTGKTILTLAAAFKMISARRYEQIILTRPMSEVGRYRLGALPGDASEKFSPYLDNYFTNIEQIVDDHVSQSDLLRAFRIKITPLQLIRGASFNNSLVIADEMQICTPGEILTLGTRIGENSKLIIMGDLNQRDERIAREETGMYQFINNETTKGSSLVAYLELQKCERSATAQLFSSVFQE